MNYNVKLALHWSLWENFSASIRSGDVLSAYLYLLTEDNAVVGYVQGANGILQLLAALPAGVLTDRWRRDSMLRASAAVGLAAGCFLAYTLLRAPTLVNVFIAMALLGCYRGFYNPPLESIFADSVRTGRSEAYTFKYIVTVLATGCGPLLSLALFMRLGNQWHAADCRHILLWGLGVMALPLALMCCFDDGKALGHHSEAVRLLPASSSDGKSVQSDTDDAEGGCCGCCPRVSPGLAVTVLISVSDFIGALASGMTLKFFALFFMQACRVAPAVVSLLGALSPLGIAAASMAAQRASRAVGRVQISLVTRAADVALLVCMAYLPTSSQGAVQLLMCVHLLRMALANCTRPLLRSVLMDHVHKRHRGKVNAIDSVRAFSWSGSAALGGILIQRLGFQATFLVTAGVKLGAFLPLLFLLRYVGDGWLAGARGAAGAAGYSLLPERVEAVEAPAGQEAAAVAAGQEGAGPGAGAAAAAAGERGVRDGTQEGGWSSARSVAAGADEATRPLLGADERAGLQGEQRAREA